jgi:hypothetical protein
MVSTNAAAQKAYEAVIAQGGSVANALSSARYAGQADAYFKSQAAAQAPTSFVGSAESRGLSDRANSERLATQVTFEKDSVKVTLPADGTVADVEPILTRALIGALSAR